MENNQLPISVVLSNWIDEREKAIGRKDIVRDFAKPASNHLLCRLIEVSYVVTEIYSTRREN